MGYVGGSKEQALTFSGLLPSWHRGHPKDFKPNMINARIEGILAKVVYFCGLPASQVVELIPQAA